MQTRRKHKRPTLRADKGEDGDGEGDGAEGTGKDLHGAAGGEDRGPGAVGAERDKVGCGQWSSGAGNGSR